MIVLNLACGEGHHFEGWFQDLPGFERQQIDGNLSCPLCGDGRIAKRPSAANIARSSSDRAADLAKQMQTALESLRNRIEQHCDYVGPAFPEEARRIHYGDAVARSIFGEATAEEARALKGEGIDIQPLPWLPRRDD